MIKPADGLIAKARAWAHKQWPHSDQANWRRDIVPHLAKFAESERQAVKEEYCRAMCVQCRRGEKLVGLRHRISDRTGEIVYYTDCEAAAIRSMGE